MGFSAYNNFLCYLFMGDVETLLDTKVPHFYLPCMYMFNKRLQESKSKEYSAKDFLESINRCTAFPQPLLASFGEFQFRTFSLDFSIAFKAEKRFVLQNTYHSRPIQKHPLN